MIGELIKTIRAEVSGDLAKERLLEIYDKDRWSTFPKYNESSKYCEQVMKEIGLSEVKRVGFPADGRSRFEDWIMPLAWDVQQATLEVVSNDVSQELRNLADYSQLPSSLVMWSAPTDEGGVEGELLVLEEGSRLECEAKSLEGKIVFTPKDPAQIKDIVASKGGVGIVSDSMRNRSLSDSVQWVNRWSDQPGGWAMHAGDSRLWGFMISPNKGSALRDIASKSKVVLRAKVLSRLYEGSLHYVMGCIPGNSGEEVLIMAHINEQGANDNASGSAAILEAARAILKLIADKKVASPQRTIRFLLMPESYGSLAFAVKEKERLRRTLSALNVDSGAGMHDYAQSALTIYLNPHCCPTFVDALMRAVVGKYYSQFDPSKPWKTSKYTLAGDNYFCEPMIGVPNPWISMGSGSDYWHNSADVPDTVDSMSLGDLACISAAFGYFLANASIREATWIAAQTFNFQADRILSLAKSLSEEALKTESWSQLEGLRRHFRHKTEHIFALGCEAIRSIERLTKGLDRGKMRENLERLIVQLNSVKSVSASMFQWVSGIHASTGVDIFSAATMTESKDDLQAAAMVPKRKLVGPLALDRVTSSQWKVITSSPRWWGPWLAAWWWADGSRNVWEIQELIKYEFGSAPEDLTDFFKFLNSQKYVDFIG